jgi:hypothetical protein
MPALLAFGGPDTNCGVGVAASPSWYSSPEPKSRENEIGSMPLKFLLSLITSVILQVALSIVYPITSCRRCALLRRAIGLRVVSVELRGNPAGTRAQTLKTNSETCVTVLIRRRLAARHWCRLDCIVCSSALLQVEVVAEIAGIAEIRQRPSP